MARNGGGRAEAFLHAESETAVRNVLHQSSLGEVINSAVGGHSEMPWGYEPAVQVVFPYFGIFSYSIGRQGWLIDPNQILVIRPGWEYVDEQPVPGIGHASLLINPSAAIVDEVIRPSTFDQNEAPFGSSGSSPRIWLMTHYILFEARSGLTELQADEWLVSAMQLAVSRSRPSDSRTTGTIRRAKEFLHAHGFDRVSLDTVAKAVGVTPVYLTQEFTRAEGMPLYQYQLNLRLARALQQLRDCEDITRLALDLGFSNHSHFTAMFRKMFGLTPSAFRNIARSGQHPAPANEQSAESL